MTLTNADLAAIQERCDAATPGPWHYRRDWVMFTDPDDGQVETIATTHESPDDARFIAHSRTDIPALLETIAELREALEWYAAKDNWDFVFEDGLGVPGTWDTVGYKFHADNGERARAALGEAVTP